MSDSLLHNLFQYISPSHIIVFTLSVWQLNQSRMKPQEGPRGMHLFNIPVKMMLCWPWKIWITRFYLAISLLHFFFFRKYHHQQLICFYFYFYQNLDGRIIYVELARPGKDAYGEYPKTSGPPKKLNLQQQDEVSDCWY